MIRVERPTILESDVYSRVIASIHVDGQDLTIAIAEIPKSGKDPLITSSLPASLTLENLRMVNVQLSRLEVAIRRQCEETVTE